MTERGDDGGPEAAAGNEQTQLAALKAEVASLRTQLDGLNAARREEQLRALDEVRCPKCRFLMDEVTQYGIVLDVCPGCKGVYFDDGEVDELIRYAEAKPGDTGILKRLFRRG